MDKMIHFKSTKKISFFTLILQALFTCMVLCLIKFDWTINACQILVIIIFIECIVLSFKQKLGNFYQIYLFCFFIFNLTRFIVNLAGLYEMQSFSWNGFYVFFSDTTIIKTCKIFITHLLGTSLGWIIAEKYINKHKNYQYKYKSLNYLNLFLIKFLFIIFTFIYSYKILIMVKMVSIYGYSWMHISESAYQYPIICRGSGTFYMVFGILALFYSRTPKSFLIHSTIFMIPQIAYLFTGLRGQPIYTLIALGIIWFFYFKPIKLRFVIPLSLSGIIGLMAIEQYRGASNVNLNRGVIYTIYDFLVRQGSSFTVTSLVIDHLDDIKNEYPFILAYIFRLFKPSVNSFPGLRNVEIKDYLTYLLAPDAYNRGLSFGGSLCAELYEFTNGNLLLITLLSILLPLFGGILIINLYKSPVVFFIGFLFFCQLSLAPRASIMRIFDIAYIRMIFMVFIIWIFLKRIRMYSYYSDFP